MDDDQHQKSGRTAGAGFRSRVSPFGPDLSPGGFSWLRSRLLRGSANRISYPRFES